MKKKVIWIILGIVLALAVVLLILWLCMSKKPAAVVPLNADDSAAKYPCTVTQDGDNIKLFIKGTLEGYEWVVTDYERNTLSTVRESADAEGTTFLVKPLMSGESCLTFSLRDTVSRTDIRSQIFLTATVQGQKVTYNTLSHKEIADDVENDNYTINQLADGSFAVNVVGKEDAEWEFIPMRGDVKCTKTDLGAEVGNGVSVAGYSVACSGTENCLFYIRDEKNNDTLKVELQYSADNGFTVLSHEWLNLEPVSTEAE